MDIIPPVVRLFRSVWQKRLLAEGCKENERLKQGLASTRVVGKRDRDLEN